MWRLQLLAAVGLIGWGCARDDAAPDAPDAMADDGADSMHAEDGSDAETAAVPVDLVVVVHTVDWMQRYLTALAQTLPRLLVEPLVERGVDLRTGILSADLGSAGTIIAPAGTACGEPCDRADGSTSSDDGTLLTRPDCWRDGIDAGRGDCAAYPHPEGVYPAFVAGSDPGFADWFSCLVVRRDGCRIPQPLGSLARALQEGRNPGFLREGSLLVVVIVANTDDCSVADPGVLADEGAIRPVGFAGRCAYRTEGLQSVAGTTEALARLRPPERLVVAVFGGSPHDYRWCGPGEPCGTCGTYDPSRPCLLEEVCTAGGTEHPVLAAPRLRDFATGLGSTTEGWPVGFAWGPCSLQPGSTGPSDEEAFGALRRAILDRLGRGE